LFGSFVYFRQHEVFVSGCTSCNVTLHSQLPLKFYYLPLEVGKLLRGFQRPFTLALDVKVSKGCNSGVFFQNRYEVQVLDSYENKTYFHGQAAAIYKQHAPLVNACRKPGEWQSYDIVFEAPRFDGDKLVTPARATVFHNGVCVQHAQELLGATQHRAVATYAAHPPKLPLRLQDHGNPVRFRNIWARPMERRAP
jgi:hypothetical protein